MSVRIVALGLVVAAASGHGQPPAAAPPAEPYTAFPKLTAPPAGFDLPKRVADRLALGKQVPADAPPLTKVRVAQVEEGVRAITMTRTRIQLGQFTSADYTNYMRLIAEVFRVQAELEPVAAGKVAAYEDRVVVMKEVERFATIRVNAGTDPPQTLHEARFWRLQAEKELLLLQEELAKGGKK